MNDFSRFRIEYTNRWLRPVRDLARMSIHRRSNEVL
jgi:hypothetical protein